MKDTIHQPSYVSWGPTFLKIPGPGLGNSCCSVHLAGVYVGRWGLGTPVHGLLQWRLLSRTEKLCGTFSRNQALEVGSS